MKLLRIEGVNLANCIYDTEDLSTRRGGGLMMLDVIHEINKETKDVMTPISTGASAGLFQLSESVDYCDAKNIISTILNKEPYCYGTFVINEVNHTDFNTAEVTSIACNRWQQMQTLSFSTHGLERSSTGVCNIDEIRPAKIESYNPESKKHKISSSIASRKEYGKTQKQAFYQSIISNDFTEGSIRFTNSFEDIATQPITNIKPNNLVGKIAVFYADGNSFGSFASRCQSAQDLREWDSYIKSERAKLLSKIVKYAKNHKHWLSKNKSGEYAIRLETLLWGGDEVMFVVPAWCGLEFAKLFFEITGNMQYPATGDTTPLTHACGLVFCHHQSPISRISLLAKDLAEKAKEHDRQSNSLNWLVLESFDHTGSGLDDYLSRQFNHQLTWDRLLLSPALLTQLKSDMPILKKSLPRSAIVKLIQYLLTTQANTTVHEDRQKVDHPLFIRAFEQITELKDNRVRLENLHEHVIQSSHQDNKQNSHQDTQLAMEDNLAFWLIIIELWDYFCEVK